MSAGRSATLSTLIDMGFGENRARRALKATNNKGVETAMEWLLSNSANDTLDDPLTDEDQELDEEKAESSEPKLTLKPMSEEEKKAKLERLEELRKKKRAEREEREKKEALEREKKRIEDGKGMTDMKQQLEQQEIRKMAELKRREKQEEKAAKAKILAQIEADKVARREKFNMKSPEGGSGGATTVAPTAAASNTQPQPGTSSSASPAAKKDYTETRLQIRQTNGQPLVTTFGVKEQLAAVRLYVQLNRTDGVEGAAAAAAPVKLMTNFPKKVFEEDDYENSLENGPCALGCANGDEIKM